MKAKQLKYATPEECQEFYSKQLSSGYNKHKGKKAPKKHYAQNAALCKLKIDIKNGYRAGLVQLPTACGKTRLPVELHKYMKSKRTLMIIHQQSILISICQEFYKFAKIKPSVMLNGKYFTFDDEVLVALVPSIYKRCHAFSRGEFDLVVADECHHGPADTWKRVLEYFKSKYRLGITATTERNDILDTYSMFRHKVVYFMTTEKAIKKGLILPYQYYLCEDDVFDEFQTSGALLYKDGVKLTRADLYRRLAVEERDKAIAKHIKKRFRKSKTFIGYVANAWYGEHITKSLNAAGIKVKFIHHHTPQTTRRLVERELEQGIIQGIISINIYTEGVNIPSVDGIVILSPTRNYKRLVQMIGRALRKFRMKRHGIVLDFCSAYEAVTHVLNYLITGKYDKGILSKVKAVYRVGKNRIIISQKMLKNMRSTMDARMSIAHLTRQLTLAEANFLRDALKAHLKEKTGKLSKSLIKKYPWLPRALIKQDGQNR